MFKQEDRGVQKEAHHFYSSVLWLHPGPVNPVSHPHQTMHPPTPKKKTKNRERKLTNLTCSFHSEDLETSLYEWGTRVELTLLTLVSKPALPTNHMDINKMGKVLLPAAWRVESFVHQISPKWHFKNRSSGSQPALLCCGTQIVVQFVSRCPCQ